MVPFRPILTVFLAFLCVRANLASDFEGGTPLTLEAARSRATEVSPRLGAARAAVREAEAGLRQAGALPDPEIGAEVEDFGGDLPRWGQSQTTLSLQMPLEFPGKRGARAEAARARLDAARWSMRLAEVDLRAEVDRRFAKLQAAQVGVELAVEGSRSARAVRESVAALVASGEVSPIEESRARAEETLSDIEADKARTGLAAARAALAELLGEPEAELGSAEGPRLLEGDFPPPTVPGEGPLPELERAKSEGAALEADFREARRSLWPDLSLGVGWRRYADTGDHAYVAELSVPLPLFGKSRAAAASASAAAERGRQEVREVESRILAQRCTARDEWEGAAREVTKIRDELVPSTSEVVEALSEGYLRGKFSLLDLLQARRDHTRAQMHLNDGQLRLRLAQIELERLRPVSAERGATP